MDLAAVTLCALIGLFGSAAAFFALLDDWYSELVPA